MSKFLITGQNILHGDIAVYGAKNQALKMFAAAILTDEDVILHNVPDILDIHVASDILVDLGASVKKEGTHSYVINCANISSHLIKDEFVRKMRASILFIVPLLIRFGEVKLSLPGGDAIGRRPIDMTTENLEKMGVSVTTKADSVSFKLKGKTLKASKLVFRWVTHTGTENMIMAATVADGTSTLINVALEPEVQELCHFLNVCGAKIRGIGTSTLVIEGVKKLSGGTATIIPDRIETGTFAAMAALSGGEVRITNCNPDHLEVFWTNLEQVGAKFQREKDSVIIKKSGKLTAINVKTHEYPGFITDIQAPFTVLLTQATGMSLVHETIYDGRLYYTDILNSMGANVILADPHRAIVLGPTKLYAKKLDSPDIRAGMALVIAALIAEGTTELNNIHHIDRGYENIDQRLTTLGADIRRIQG